MCVTHGLEFIRRPNLVQISLTVPKKCRPPPLDLKMAYLGTLIMFLLICVQNFNLTKIAAAAMLKE